ncbi:TPA: phosphoribosylglycinamide formyltransferase [Candidatus Gastranaerophilales bacterium HUM_20]|nr:putative uncharacterized protein [Clostridium sp. CAG:729]DAB22128.1 MAG TPA: phosphoribosylglycinamide formyltransferase [Candidatus Gastranaerophilales bacterium HUM_20]
MNMKINVKYELKSLIAKKASSLKKVCEILGHRKNEQVSPNNITNKLRRKTIKFEEVQDILDVLDYHIEFVENKKL